MMEDHIEHVHNGVPREKKKKAQGYRSKHPIYIILI